jgi:hypothetical protein
MPTLDDKQMREGISTHALMSLKDSNLESIFRRLKLRLRMSGCPLSMHLPPA